MTELNGQADPAAGIPLEAPQTEETAHSEVSATDNDSGESDRGSEPDTFPRSYVEQLRRESAGYRDKAKQAAEEADQANAYAEGFMRRLHTALVAATGKLADPADLEFDAEHLMDEDNLNAAIDALIADKPYLKARRVAGDVGQGNRGEAAGFSLLDVLKSRA